jgi:hypothetical protein
MELMPFRPVRTGQNSFRRNDEITTVGVAVLCEFYVHRLNKISFAITPDNFGWN